MPSTISWLDFSDSDRRKMIEVISLFKQRDTRDEMGLAQIRDGFAETFFPGTTTIQTRARYFLFIPWLYRYHEARKTPSAKIAYRMRNCELRVMKALGDAGETDGVIGQRAGASLQRFPSSVYWNGLRVWGILRFPGTMYQYYRSLDRYYRSRTYLPEIETTELVQESNVNWDPNLPPMPDDFPKKASFEITAFEASYLRERLLLSCNQSLLAYLVDQGQPVEVDFGWLHPNQVDFPDYLKEKLLHARNFSDSMQGAALLYNLMLAEKRGSEELVEEYRDRIHNWRQRLLINERDLLIWDRSAFWKLTEQFGRVYAATQLFVNDWLALLLDGSAIADPIEDQKMHKIVHDREYRLKRNRSRLENPRHLELWSGDAGTGQLDFRWGIGNRIARDIQTGLAKPKGGQDAFTR